jgi:hypothetical protein
MGMRNALAQQNIANQPAPLSRRCAYCACHVEPVKDCPHCGAPA